MKRLNYRLEFPESSLGIINEKKIISKENLSIVYYQLTNIAEKFAKW